MNDKKSFSKKVIFGWAMFDFANSSFTTVMVTAYFNMYFISVIAKESGNGASLWGLANGISQALVIFTAPLIGALADIHCKKKHYLFITYLICSIFTFLLGFAKPGMVAFAFCLFVIANYAFSIGENIISSLLPDIVPKEIFGRVSGIAWGVGYIGGIGSLICSVLILNFFGENQGFSYVWMMIGCWFFLAGIPTFIFVPESKIQHEVQPKVNFLSFGFKLFLRSFSESKKFKHLFRFLLAFTIYSSGVMAVVSFASIIAKEKLNFGTTELGIFLVVTNIAALFGSLSIGFIQDKLGSKFAILLSIGGWLLSLVLIILSDHFSGDVMTKDLSVNLFWCAGSMVGLSMGAIYASSRAAVGELSPKARSGEFYGIWGVFGKLGAIIGPLSFGVLTDLISMDFAILSLASFFVIGFWLIWSLDVKAGSKMAEADKTPC